MDIDRSDGERNVHCCESPDLHGRIGSKEAGVNDAGTSERRLSMTRK
jgi:hypothetical protein